MDYETKPLTRETIRSFVPYYRELFGVPHTGPFPVLEALEKISDVFKGSRYESEESYIAHSVKFANTVDRKNCVSFIDERGSTYKYNKKTNEFAIITKKGVVVTYYKPEKGYKYYMDQKKMKGRKKHGK